MGQFDTPEMEEWLAKHENMTEEEWDAEEKETNDRAQKEVDNWNSIFEVGMLVKLKKFPGNDRITGFGKVSGDRWIKTAKHFQVGDQVLLMGGPYYLDWHCMAQDGAIVYINVKYFDRDSITT